MLLVQRKRDSTRSVRIDWVFWEAVEARMNKACLGFSTSLGARLSKSRFVRAVVGFLMKC